MQNQKRDQIKVVREFVQSMGKLKHPTINAELLKNYIVNIAVDEDSIEEFIAYTDRFLKHNQTFQMCFLLHTISSILMFTPLGTPTKQIANTLSVNNNIIQISDDDYDKLRKLPESNRYDSFCQTLLERDSKLSQRLDNRIEEGRKTERIDDGTEKNQIFDPKWFFSSELMQT